MIVWFIFRSNMKHHEPIPLIKHSTGILATPEKYGSTDSPAVVASIWNSQNIYTCIKIRLWGAKKTKTKLHTYKLCTAGKIMTQVSSSTGSLLFLVFSFSICTSSDFNVWSAPLKETKMRTKQKIHIKVLLLLTDWLTLHSLSKRSIYRHSKAINKNKWAD